MATKKEPAAEIPPVGFYSVTRPKNHPGPGHLTISVGGGAYRLKRGGNAPRVRLTEEEVRQLAGDGYKIEAAPEEAPADDRNKFLTARRTRRKGARKGLPPVLPPPPVATPPTPAAPAAASPLDVEKES